MENAGPLHIIKDYNERFKERRRCFTLTRDPNAKVSLTKVASARFAAKIAI